MELNEEVGKLIWGKNETCILLGWIRGNIWRWNLERVLWGTTWTLRSSGTTKTLYGVTYGNSNFFAVGSQGIVLKSSDGTSWSSVSTAASDSDNSSVPGFSSSNQLNDISYGSSTYVIVGSNFSGSAGSIYTSSDGTTWTLRSSGTSLSLYGVTSIE